LVEARILLGLKPIFRQHFKQPGLDPSLDSESGANPDRRDFCRAGLEMGRRRRRCRREVEG